MVYSEARAVAAIWTLGDVVDCGGDWDRWISGMLPTSVFMHSGQTTRRTLAVYMASDSSKTPGTNGIYEARLLAALRTLTRCPEEWIAWITGQSTNAMFLFRGDRQRREAAAIAGNYYEYPTFERDLTDD